MNELVRNVTQKDLQFAAGKAELEVLPRKPANVQVLSVEIACRGKTCNCTGIPGIFCLNRDLAGKKMYLCRNFNIIDK
ncbi:hypothetical protein VN24_17030 [Paenibacillus beijingensis]|uniref:Lantibiotic n=1 Tax=Paenibacillus beijingensis TaxID=1126833 RepID=A0A0D5NLY2_9BACL|nr:hypothetical protein VN24_17030 [Paenibacillus beijingensis]